MMRWGVLVILALLGNPVAPPVVAQDSGSAGIQIATGYSIVCLLRRSLWTGGESAVKCWGLGVYGAPEGSELPVPALNHARAIAASRAAACAIDGSRIRCWGYRRDDDGDGYATNANRAFADFSHPLSISGGTADICAIDAEQGVRCVHQGGYITDPSHPIAGPKRAAPAPYLVQPGYALACAIGGDEKAYCWETQSNRCGSVSDYSTPLQPLRHPSELVVSPNSNGTACRPCVIDQGDVHCWGTPEHYAKLTRPSGLSHPTQLTQLDRKEHAGLDIIPCVIDEGKVKCRSDDGAFVPFASYVGFTNPVALAANDTVHCAANEQILECHYGDEFRKKELRIPHGLWFRPFGIADLADALDRLAKISYADEALLYRAAAKALSEGMPSLSENDRVRLRSFVARALKPLVDSSGGEFVDRFVKPNWDRLLIDSGLASLRDYDGWLPAKLAALEIVHGALPALRALRPAVESPEWKRFLVALGEAMASHGSTSSLRILGDRFATLRGTLSAIGQSSRGRGSALVVLGLMELLQP